MIQTIGATLDEDRKKRIQAAFWTWALGRIKYVAVRVTHKRVWRYLKRAFLATVNMIGNPLTGI